MSFLLKNKLRFFLLPAGLILAAFLAFFSSQALANYELYFTGFSVEKTSLNPGEEIKGSFTIWNYESSYLSDMTYGFKLMGKGSDGYYSVVWDDKQSGDTFSISADQKVTRPFSYVLPKNLKAGDYRLRIEILNPSMVSAAASEKDINIQTSQGAILLLQNGRFLKGTEDLGNEALYDPSETPQISFDILNDSSVSAKARPVISIYKDSVSSVPLQKIEGNFVNINAGYVQNQKMDLIKLTNPNMHVCEVSMRDEKGERVSNSLYFWWTISATGGAEILETKTDQSSYKEGQEANVSVNIGAETGEGSSSERAEVLVKLVDENNNVVGETKQSIDLKGGEVSVAVPVTKGVSNPKVEVTVFDSQNNQIDKYPIKGSAGEAENGGSISKILLVVGCLAAIILATFLVVVFSRRENKPKKGRGRAMLFIFVFMFLGFVQPAQAETVVPGLGSLFGLETQWDRPIPLYLYNVGGYVNFSGSVYIDGMTKFKDLTDTQIDFFVGKELGNNKYPVLEFDWDKKIQLIDEDNAQNKANMLKLGTYAGYHIASDKAVHYDINFPIPSNFQGESRFYIQFRGKRDGMPFLEWSSIIAYQKVTIQKSEEGGLDVTLVAKDKTTGKGDSDGDGVIEASPGDTISYIVTASNKSFCTRLPVDVMLVMDRSGSMDWDGGGGKTRIDYAKEAANIFIDQMDSKYDQVGLASYESTATLDSQLKSDFSAVKTAISSMDAIGGTCAGCGINKANAEFLSPRKRAEAVQYEVLMTDGQTNTCISGSCDPFSEALSEAKKSGAKVFTVGFGSDATGEPPLSCGTYPSLSCNLLNAIADSTGGTYSYAPTGEKLKSTFEAIAGALVGKSYGTKISIYIDPQYFELVSGSYDSGKCSFNASTNILTCEIGFMNCSPDGTIDSESFSFDLLIKTGISDDKLIITEAKVINDANQLKSDTFEIQIEANIPPEAIIFCDPDECDIDGCGHDCCKCYTDSFLKIENKSKAHGKTSIWSSTWSIKDKGEADSAYETELSGLGKLDFPKREFTAGNYTVKLEVMNDKGSSDSATRDIVYYQGAYGGFACSMNGKVWYDCESSDFKPAKGEQVWLTDDPNLAVDPLGNILDHSIPSYGSTGSNATRYWYVMDGAVKKSLGQDNKSTITMIIDQLPTIVILEYNDGERQAPEARHTLDMIPTPTWVETDPFKNTNN